jgi:hypothetical protein
MKQKWHLPNEMLRLPPKIHRTSRKSIPHQIQRTYKAIRNNNSNSGYSNHILNTGYTYETIIDKLDIMRTHRKRKTLKDIGKNITHTHTRSAKITHK